MNDDIEGRAINNLFGVLSKTDINYLRSLTDSSDNSKSPYDTLGRDLFEAFVWCLGGTFFHLISEPIIAIILFLVSVGMELYSLWRADGNIGWTAVTWSFILLTIISCIYIPPLLGVTSISGIILVGMVSALCEMAVMFLIWAVTIFIVGW